MSWPSLPPQATDPWYTPFSAAWAAVKTYVDTLLSGKVGTSRTVSTGTGLTGGGDLSADRTLALASVADQRVLGNVSGASAAPIPLTAAQVKTMLAIAQGDVAGLTAALASKLDTSVATSTYIPLSQKDVANGVAVLDGTQKIALARIPQGANGVLLLDGSGLVPTAALPPLAINETFVVANQAAMLALTAQRGDMAIRTDNSRTYVLASDSPATLADWKEVLAPGVVASVAGQTGVVVLGIGDITGLTSALAGKAATTTTLSAGTGLAGGGDLSANRTFSLASVLDQTILGNVSGSSAAPAALTAAQVKTMLAIAIGDVSGLGTALSAKLDASTAATTYIPLSQKDAANGVAVLDGAQKIALARIPQGANGVLILDGSGLVPSAALPPLAINETFVVADQAAMLALTAQRGDMAIRGDNGRTYVLATDSPSTLADWKEVLAAGQVSSVNGQTGVVSLAVADITGLTAALAAKADRSYAEARSRDRVLDRWRFRTAVSAAVATGDLRLNNATMASVTQIVVHTTSMDSWDATTDLPRFQPGSLITLRNPADLTQVAYFRVTGAGTVASSNITITVEFVASNGTWPPTDNLPIALGGSPSQSGLPLALTGATAATRYVGATASGAPVSGTFRVGDVNVGQNGTLWVCTAAGSPGTWSQVGSGGTLYPAFPNPGPPSAGGSVAPVYNNMAELTTRGVARWMYVYLYDGVTYNGLLYRSWTQGSGTTVRAAVYDARSSLLNPTLIAATEVNQANAASGSVSPILFSATWTVPGTGWYALAGGLVGGTGSIYGASPVPQAANVAGDVPTALSVAQDHFQALTTAMPALLAGVTPGAQINTCPIFQLRKA